MRVMEKEYDFYFLAPWCLGLILIVLSLCATFAESRYIAAAILSVMLLLIFVYNDILRLFGLVAALKSANLKTNTE